MKTTFAAAIFALASFVSVGASAICHPYPECQYPDPDTPLNGAVFVSQSVPQIMVSGQSYPVSITMMNNGSNTWATSTYKLVAINPVNNTTWGLSQVSLTSAVAYGGTATFNFTVVAPANPSEASVNFQWQMRKGTTTLFGDVSPNVPVLPTTTNVTIGTRKFIAYDEEGQVQQLTGTNGQWLSYFRSGAGDSIGTLDSGGNASVATVDGFGRQSSITNPASGTTEYTYSKHDGVATIKDSRNNTASYTLDGFGQAVGFSSPDAGTTTSVYDEMGGLTSNTIGAGTPDALTITFVRDAYGRPTSISSGSKQRTLTYESCTNGKSQLCTSADDVSDMSFTYTPLGQVATQTSRVIEDSFILQPQPSIALTYDAAGRYKTITYPNGYKLTYTYNAAGIVQADMLISGTSYPMISDIKMSAAGPIGQWTYGNGLVRQSAFDTDGRLTSITTLGGVGTQNLTYTYDTNNRITAIANARATGLNQTFSYDAAGRVTGYTSPVGPAVALQYDTVGNRTQRLDGGALTWNMTYASGSNRLLSASGINSRTWNYDGRGNVTSFTASDGIQTTLTYDEFNRLSGASRGVASVRYLMDVRNQLAYRDSGTGKNTFYVYLPDGRLIAEYNTFQSQWTNYLWIDGEIGALTRGSGRYYVHNDHLGRPEVITDGAKAVAWSTNLSAFTRDAGTSAGFGEFNVGFPGQIWDTLGFWHNGFRTYEYSTGRYLQADPLGAAGGMNSFAYAQNNPASFVDSLGLRALTKCETSILQPYYPKVNLSQVSFYSGWWTPVPPTYRAITFGSTIYANAGEDEPNSLKTIVLLGHELEHVRQYGEYAPMGMSNGITGSNFVRDYLDNYFNNLSEGMSHTEAYSNIHFETDAQAMEKRIAADLARKGFSETTCDCESK